MKIEDPKFKKTAYGFCWKPLTWKAWFVTAVWIIGNMLYFVRIDKLSHSVSDTLLNFAPFFVFSTLIYLAIIRATCAREW